MLDTQFIHCLAQDVVLADLEDCADQGGLDKAEHPAISVENGPEFTSVVVDGALELGDPEMAEGIADHRTKGGEGVYQGNVCGPGRVPSETYVSPSMVFRA